MLGTTCEGSYKQEIISDLWGMDRRTVYTPTHVHRDERIVRTMAIK